MVTGGAITLADGIVLAGAIPGVIGVVELPWSKGAIPLASIPVTSVGSKSTTGLLPALPLPFTFPGAAAGGALTAGGVGINGRMIPLACPCPLLSWGICLGPPKGALASGFGFSPLEEGSRCGLTAVAARGHLWKLSHSSAHSKFH